MSDGDIGLDPEERLTGDENVSPAELVLGSIFLRDRTAVESVCLQFFFICMGVFGISSMLYYLFLVSLISYHHFKRDRYVYVIPKFISEAEEYTSAPGGLDQADAIVFSCYQKTIQKARLRKGRLYLRRVKARKKAKTITKDVAV